MPNYTAPGVYINDVVSGSQSGSSFSSTVGVLIGTAISGAVNVAQKITSWAEYIEKYANGLSTPYSTDYLPYAVYGFFQNGGKELYVINVKKNATKATATFATAITVTASSEGTWGNSIAIKVTAVTGTSTFDVKISVGSSDSVTLYGVTEDTIASAIAENYKASSWIGSITVGGTAELEAEEVTLSGGSEGASLTDTEYVGALDIISTLDDVTFVGVVGQTSNTVINAVITYCDTNGLFPILDAPISSTVENVKTLRRSLNGFTGALMYPWGKIVDPNTNALKSVPTVGHVMGVYARVIESRGVFKAPAGTDAQVLGFVEMDTNVTQTDLSALNPIGVICIIAKPNMGIVIWGARSINSTDSTMRYVSDGLLNLNIKRSLYNSTQYAVFEPNDEELRSRVKTSCISFLETLRSEGALKGTADEAYYVIVDDSNNTEATISEGQLNIEVGYAPIKPAEFVIIKLAHSIVGEA